VALLGPVQLEAAETFLQLARVGERERFANAHDEHTRDLLLCLVVVVNRDPLVRVRAPANDLDSGLCRTLNDEDEREAD
jgi:hypothetical protein